MYDHPDKIMESLPNFQTSAGYQKSDWEKEADWDKDLHQNNSKISKN